jgi:hypothetical protein
MEQQSSSTSIAQLREMARAHSSSQSSQPSQAIISNGNASVANNQIPSNLPPVQIQQQSQSPNTQQVAVNNASPQVQYQQQFQPQIPQTQPIPNYIQPQPQPVYNHPNQSQGYITPPNAPTPYINQAQPIASQQHTNTDNPLDIFGTDTRSTQGAPVAPCQMMQNACKQAPSSCAFDIKSNFRLAAIISIVALVVGLIPIQSTIGNYIPLNRLPFGGGIAKASLIGSLSAFIIGFFM